MRYKVRHLTTYRYSRPVFLEPHTIRLRPRNDPYQNLIQFDLRVSPQPAGLSTGIDAENNAFHLVWFNDLTDTFKIESSFIVETLKANPFDSFLTSGDTLPLVFPGDERTVLGSCLDTAALMDTAERKLIDDLSRQILAGSEGSVFGFLKRLNSSLFDTIEKIVRLEGGLQPIGQTIATARGACRDTALVFMAVCRFNGIPARFVSGCQEGDPDQREGELHAWAEVYLPGFGWKGYDPTHGLAVADRHIAYGASAIPENISPVTGSFRGTGATSRMSHMVEIERQGS